MKRKNKMIKIVKKKLVKLLMKLIILLEGGSAKDINFFEF